MNRDTSEFVNSVFEQPWWLDVVAPNKWEEIFVKENGEIIARWPIVYKFRGIGMPKMTQTLGFWLSENIKNSDPYYIKRKRITNLLVDQLPKHKNIKIRLNPIVDYFLPMYWKHYIISPYISYRIIDLTDINDVYKRFNRIVKGNIRSANNKMIVKAIDDIEILLMLMDKTFSLQNRKNPFSRALVRIFTLHVKNIILENYYMQWIEMGMPVLEFFLYMTTMFVML